MEPFSQKTKEQPKDNIQNNSQNNSSNQCIHTLCNLEAYLQVISNSIKENQMGNKINDENQSIIDYTQTIKTIIESVQSGIKSLINENTETSSQAASKIHEYLQGMSQVLQTCMMSIHRNNEKPPKGIKRAYILYNKLLRIFHRYMNKK